MSRTRPPKAVRSILYIHWKLRYYPSNNPMNYLATNVTKKLDHNSEQILDEFDRVVFESIIEKVLVGGFDEKGNPDPYKLTFVLKGKQSGIVPNAKEHYKAIQKELKKGNKVS